LLIDHSGYTDAEINYITTFVLNEIIGTQLVAIDNTRFKNVGIILNDINYIFVDIDELSNKYTKFLNEETFDSYYYDQTLNHLYGADAAAFSTRDFYSEDPTNQNTDDVNQINTLSNLSKSIVILQASRFDVFGNDDDYKIKTPDRLAELYPGDSYFYNTYEQDGRVLESGYLQDPNTLDYLPRVVVNRMFKNFADTNNDGGLTTDYWDLDNDGQTDDLLTESIYNGSSTMFIYSIRRQYFKNYVNTVYEAVKNTVRKPLDEQTQLTYAQKTFN
jgi:hypothetical protein